MSLSEIPLSKILQLPIELADIIYLYIPLSAKQLLTTKYFNEHYNQKMKTMTFSEYSNHDSYIRDMVRLMRFLVLNN